MRDSDPSPSRELSKSLRVNNYNLAGGSIFVVMVVGPLVLGWLVYLIVMGGVRNEDGELTLVLPIILLVIGSVIQLIAIVYALTVPVLWVEIGGTLRYATLLRVHDVDWGDVQRIWFDREDVKLHTLLPVTLVERFVLAIQVSEYRSLRVLVPTSRMPLVAAIMNLHPKFKDSPFDDEPVDEVPEEEYWDESDETAWNDDEDD
jgi:hypothetical protein